jgi:peptidyl-dipeptidase Dcp
MKSYLAFSALILAALAACATPPPPPPPPPPVTKAPAESPPPPPAAPPARKNPLFTESELALHAPRFDLITDADYEPAFLEGMRRQIVEMEEIAGSPVPPTFENTIVAMERTGLLLTRVQVTFNGVASANTNPTLQQLQETVAPKLAAHQDAIHLNARLFARVDAVYKQRDSLKLDPESRRLLEVDEQQFVLAGANLNDADKARLKALNEEEASLAAKFVNQLLAGATAGALIVTDAKELDGLTPGELDAAAQAAKARKLDNQWLIPLQNTTQQPSLASLKNRATREKLFEHSWNRTERGDANDTRKIIAQLAKLRAEKASLLGYPSYAAWRLQDQMAKTPEAIATFLAKVVPATTAKARGEAKEIQKVIDSQKGKFKLMPWDWNYYAEQVRKAKYDLDEAEVKPYFELNHVLQDGVFYAANQLYGLTFHERRDLPVYHPDVRVFDVMDKDGTQLGLFYCDYFKRDNKTGGAWMDVYTIQSHLLGDKPVIYNVTNFTKPAPGQPALISFDDATTMFHEFGHGLHGLFANQQYPSLSGAQTARDYVEFPSQFNEHWAFEPSVFAHYAKHYQTGEPMPAKLVEKIKKARHFNGGYALTEILAAAALDLEWHALTKDAPLQDPDVFEQEALKRQKLDLPQVPSRYRSSYFLHIWANGYSAGYYAYLWTEMLDDDAYEWFVENGGMTRANGDRFREMILSRGNSQDYGEMFKAFRGRAPEIKPMLKNRGLLDK